MNEQLQSYATLSQEEGIGANRLAFSAQGLLAVKGNEVEVWDPNDPKRPWHRFPAYGGPGRPAWSPDGKQLALGDAASPCAALPSVVVWDLATDDSIARHVLREGSHAVTALAWSPDGRRLALGTAYPLVRLWEPAADNVLYTVLPSGAPPTLAWSPDGKLLAIPYGAWGIKLLEIEGKSFAQDCAEAGHRRKTVTEVAFAPDGSRLALGTADGHIEVWQPGSREASPRLLLTFSSHLAPVRGLCWSPDGNHILSGSLDRRAFLWDARTGEVLSWIGIRGEGNGLEDAAWSPDATCIATCDARGVVEFYRVPALAR